MSSNIKSELFFLRQFGFSNRLLEEIYLSEKAPLSVVFSKNEQIYKKFKFSKKDRELSEYIEEYYKFKPNFFKEEEFLKKNSINKIYFKYDKTLLNDLIPQKKMPLFMYSKGSINLLEEGVKRVAIVGTRKPTEESVYVTKKIVEKYIKDDYVIVSGLAEGIDTISHEAAVSQLGRTIAVLPTNFKKIYPKENKKLAEDILKKGLLLTAIGPNEHTFKSNFLDRNQYVANICDFIIVIETSLKSGTMNTIRNASEAGKKIFYLEQEEFAVNEKIKSYGGVMIDGDE